MEIEAANESAQLTIADLQKNVLKLRNSVRENVTDACAIKDVINDKELEIGEWKSKFQLLEDKHNQVRKRFGDVIHLYDYLVLIQK